MPYIHRNNKGVYYHLRKSEVKLRGEKMQTIYFFTKATAYNPKGIACELPDDREVVENPRNGFLTLRKKNI